MTATSRTAPMPPQRALQRAAPRGGALATRRAALPFVVERALPALAGSASALAIGLLAEYALRALAGGVVVAARAPLQRLLPARAVKGVTRTVITELVVIERSRRRG